MRQPRMLIVPLFMKHYTSAGWYRKLTKLIPAIVFGLAGFFAISYVHTRYADYTYQNHAVTKLGYWKAAFSKPIEARIGPASSELVDFLAQANRRQGYPNQPRSTSTPPADLLADVKDAFADLPAPVRSLFSKKLAGIYLVQGLGSSGLSAQIYDGRNAVAGLIVLDTAVLQAKTANTWATWKENTPFIPNANYRLVATLEEPPQDTRKQLIQYILLHELGHVIDFGGNLNPNWDLSPNEITDGGGSYTFFRLSWLVSKELNQYASIFDHNFTQRKDLVYYLGAKLPSSQIVRTYDTLERTSFATLYGATNPYDDFAEAFANYVHTVMMGKPYQITVYVDGKIAKTFRPCWSEDRCKEKRLVLERLIESN